LYIRINIPELKPAIGKAIIDNLSIFSDQREPVAIDSATKTRIMLIVAAINAIEDNVLQFEIFIEFV